MRRGASELHLSQRVTLVAAVRLTVQYLDDEVAEVGFIVERCKAFFDVFWFGHILSLLMALCNTFIFSL